MKLLLGLLVSLAISSAFALPARHPKDEVDVVEVPRGPQRSRESTGAGDDDDTDVDFRDFKGVVDTGAGYPFLAPLPHPFSFNLGFFDSFEDIFRRLRTRLWSADSEGSSEEGGFSLGLDPTKGANTTSVVKVVDGHKIEINDTVYGNGDGSNGAVFKFRIINIRPLESGEEVPEAESTQAPATEIQNRDIEGNSDEKRDSSDEEVKPDDNEINANVDDPESTTEAITTEMHDTVPHRIPSSDNNDVDNDSPVNRDELLEDVVGGGDTTEAVESLDDDVATLAEEVNTDAAGNTMKSEKLSALVDAENINDADESTQPTAATAEDENNDAEDRENNESIESQNVDAEQEQMQELVAGVGERLSMADDEEERLAEEVENMVAANIDDQQKDTIEEESQKLEQHSLREDLSSSDDEEDAEDVNDVVSYHGLNSEWGSLDDKNILTNEIDVYESVPIDLSNDIAINDIMADQGAPVDPDAEVFSVDVMAAPSAGEARFEALADIK